MYSMMEKGFQDMMTLGGAAAGTVMYVSGGTNVPGIIAGGVIGGIIGATYGIIEGYAKGMADYGVVVPDKIPATVVPENGSGAMDCNKSPEICPDILPNPDRDNGNVNPKNFEMITKKIAVPITPHDAFVNIIANRYPDAVAKPNVDPLASSKGPTLTFQRNVDNAFAGVGSPVQDPKNTITGDTHVPTLPPASTVFRSIGSAMRSIK
jgi:hypothetical protein